MACKDYKGKGGELGRDLMGCCRETEVDARAGGEPYSPGETQSTTSE